MLKRGSCVTEFRQYFRHSYSDFFQIWSAQHCVARIKDRFLEVKVKDKEMLYCNSVIDCYLITWHYSMSLSRMMYFYF